jgi:hypothetical protein
VSLTITDLQAAHAALQAFTADEREPEHHRVWYGATAARVDREIQRLKAWTSQPQFSPNPLTQQVILFWQTVKMGASDRLQWVMPQGMYDQLAAENRVKEPPGRFWPLDEPPAEPLPATLFGVPIRIDDHAPDIMLEMRP